MYVCMICMTTSVHEHVCMEVRGQCQVFSANAHYFSFETGPLTKLGVYLFGYVRWPIRSKDPLVSIPSFSKEGRAQFHDVDNILNFYLCAHDFNSSFHACTVVAIQTIIPQPRTDCCCNLPELL